MRMHKVFVVDDEIVIREGLRNNFPWEESGFLLAGEAPDGEIALSMLQDIKPDILITDIKMPFMDGLMLCRKIVRTMPWIHIVILSGYDDFSYAREAISLGVKEYLLKPVSAHELGEVLRRIASAIDEERRQQADYEAMRRQLDSSSRFMQERLLLELLSGAEGDLVLEQARKLRVNLLARWYWVMLIATGEEDDMLLVRAHTQRLAEGSGGAVNLCETGGRIAVIVLGDSAEDLEERAFAFAQAVKYEVERSVGVTLRVAIGAPAEGIDGVAGSYASAQDVLRGMVGRYDGTRIMDTVDLGMQVGAKLMGLDVVPLFEKLRYASSQEAEEILKEHFDSIGTVARQSVIMANYLYVDILLAAMRVIRENGGDPVEIIPEAVQQQAGALKTFSGHEDMVDSARGILLKAIQFRDSQTMSRYGSVIRSACAYIDQHYMNPDMTLSDVAKHVALSNNHFCTVFSQEMGVTFIEYLTKLRMKKARDLLKSTDMRSSEVSVAIGYNDPHYFSYLFKKNVGMNPRDYRNSCKR